MSKKPNNKKKKGGSKSSNKSKKSKPSSGNQSYAPTPSPSPHRSPPDPAPLPSTFQLHIEMLSDWHIGSGTGRPGDIDRLVQKDPSGLPYLPAKTLTGIWRDAAELLADGLGDPWPRWVTYLFGDQPALNTESNRLPPPQPAALSIRSAHFPDNLKQALQSRPQVQKVVTFVKPGVSIDPETGCARQDFLRFEEMVRGGITLTASCHLQLPPDPFLQTAVSAFLIASTRLVEQIGGKRRRGSGSCQFSLQTSTKLDTCISWLEHYVKDPQLTAKIPITSNSAPAEVPSIPAKDLQQTPSKAWIRLPYTITTLAPVIIAKHTIGNVVESLDYIPGSHLLKWVGKKLAPAGILLQEVIAAEDLILTHATIDIEGQPGRPVPLALHADKLKGGLDKPTGTVLNRLQETEEKVGGSQLKGIRTGYVGSNSTDSLPAYKNPASCFNTHNTIQDEVQRPTSDVGGVYTYEGIPTGSVLRGEIRLTQALVSSLQKTQPQWWQPFNDKAQLGQSKKDDYGLVDIKVEPPITVQTHSQPASNPKTLTVWLLSDLLLRDKRLRPTADLDCLEQHLGHALGVSLTLPREMSSEGIPAYFCRQRRTDSWQVSWGLPRPSLAGLSAGSCFKFEVSGALDPNKLTELEITGLGERRIEGYGQLCFNDPLLARATSGASPYTASHPQNPDSPSTPPLISETDPVYSYARLLEKAAWRQAIEKRCLLIASDTRQRQEILGIRVDEDKESGEKTSQPPASQLGLLRSVIGRLSNLNDSGAVTRWIESLEKVKNRLDKWPSGSLNKIKTLVSEPEHLWQILDIPTQELQITADADERLRRQLWAETVRLLVYYCIRSHQRKSVKWNKEGLNGKADQLTNYCQGDPRHPLPFACRRHGL